MGITLVVAGADGIQHPVNVEGALVGIRDRENPVYSILVIAEMGNEKPAEIVSANDRRRALIICNTSDAVGYLSIGDSANLTCSTYSLRIGPGETLVFSAPISIQPIYAVCGQSNKTLCYQDAT